MGKKAACRERAVHRLVRTLDEDCERGGPPVTVRLPRASGRNLRYFHPTATQLLRKHPRRVFHRTYEKHD